mmetsp:Transcript_16524/g.27935  ORF Transcript_16524/g.27935 Transcript_16524/m.27935 type:complete len:352 (-) Transcript_16524:5-1060(-)
MHHLAKRRRTKVNAPKPSSFDLTITGEVCIVQQKNQLSSQETGHLIQLSYNNVSSSSWNTYGDENDEDDGGSHGTRKQSAHLLVDRRDARTLMDELSLQQLCHKRLGPSFNTDGVINKDSSGCHHGGELEEEGSREEIDQRNSERFGMLPAEWKACTTIGKPDVEENDKAEHHDTCEDNKEIDDDPFEPTEEQRRGIPNDMILPRTMRQHNIIELTAARVANNHQLEIFLKLKQSNNNHLSFIHRADDLHPYYLHLKGKCSGEKQASDKANSSVSEGKSGLNVLLAGYESSSSDDEDTNKVTELKVGPAASVHREKTNDDESDEQIRKDERLERLRQWKISKNLQTTDDNE